VQNLSSYLLQRLPEGMSYSDAKQLCLRLYCTVDGVPEIFRSQLTKQGLAEIFAKLAAAGWIHENGKEVHAVETSHWVEVISSILQMPEVADLPRGEQLARRVGFRR
jgi:hypothetical protein